MVSLNQFNDALGSNIHIPSNTILALLILKFFLILLNSTEHIIGNSVVAYHKNYLPVFDNISYRKFNVIFQTELLGWISVTYLSM